MSNALLDGALSYGNRGLSVIPIVPRDKKPDLPSWDCFMHARAQRDTIVQWWEEKPQRNVGIVAGEVSGGLVVMDFDSIPAFQQFGNRFPSLTETRIHLSGSLKGYHAFYFVSIIPQSSKYDTIFGRIEIKSNGTQVVAPPSIHPTGNKYALYRRHSTMKVHDMGDVIDWLLSNKAKKKAPVVNFTPAAQPAGRVDNLSSSTLDLMGGQAMVGERNNRLFSAACDLAGNGITLEEARAMLSGSTDLPEREAQRTILSAYQKPRTPARPAKMEERRNSLIDKFSQRVSR